MEEKREAFMTIRAVIFDIGGVLIEIDWEHYRENQSSEIMSEDLRPYERLNPRMAQLLKKLRPDYKLATICNGGSREAMNRRFHLDKLVDLMVFDGEEGVSKPDAQIYQRTLTRLGAQAEEAVFVDDKLENVEAARHLGMHGVHYKDVRQAISEIKAILEKSLFT
jgi:HAD superfamily hydrolase (TIGR01509 family)